jgi:protein-L-isoaspartate(D-aspartate) O-methyltransferase
MIPPFDQQRERMVQEQLQARGISDERVLTAFRRVPRHLFVPDAARAQAYTDHPLPIGSGQTISQPYIVALMTSHLRLHGHERVLEVGAGSGYQTAILAELALDVYSVERLPELLSGVQERILALGYLNVHLSAGNGSLGWPEHAPYDAIVVTAGAPAIPPPLLEQLAERGRLVIPIGSQEAQTLVAVEKRRQSLRRRELTSCVFVPLLGKYGWENQSSD